MRGRTLVLEPVPEADPRRERFKQIAQEAMQRAYAAGHAVNTHSSSMDSFGRDSVSITFRTRI